jgi:hypothetical protein
MSNTESKAIAFDDLGKPITEDDLVAESHQPLSLDGPVSVVPPFDFEGDDDEWETHCLIESVKRRRSNRNEKESGNV